MHRILRSMIRTKNSQIKNFKQVKIAVASNVQRYQLDQCTFNHFSNFKPSTASRNPTLWSKPSTHRQPYTLSLFKASRNLLEQQVAYFTSLSPCLFTIEPSYKTNYRHRRSDFPLPDLFTGSPWVQLWSLWWMKLGLRGARCWHTHRVYRGIYLVPQPRFLCFITSSKIIQVESISLRVAGQTGLAETCTLGKLVPSRCLIVMLRDHPCATCNVFQAVAVGFSLLVWNYIFGGQGGGARRLPRIRTYVRNTYGTG